MKTVSLRSALVLVLAAAALSASAQTAPVFTLNSPNVFTLPASGSASYSVAGTFAAPVGTVLGSFNYSNFTGPGSLSVPTVNFTGIQAALDTTGFFSGTILTYTFFSSNVPGVYTSTGAYFNSSRGVSNSQPQSITLQAVPEPASLAALGLPVLALLRRRKA